MGIHGLSEFIRRKELIESVPKSDFSGMKVAIDAMVMIYQAVYGSTKRLLYIQLEDNDFDLSFDEFVIAFHQNLLSEIEEGAQNTIRDRFNDMRRFNVTPIYVFDSPTPMPEKKDENAKRKEAKVATLREIYESKDTQVSMKLVSRAGFSYSLIERLRQFMIDESMTVLESTGDGEMLCAALYSEGIVGAVMSTDTDVLAYGVYHMIKDWRPGNDECNILPLSKVIEAISDEIDYVEFVDMCILCGCDFNTHLKGYGVVKAARALSKCGWCLDNLNEKDKHLLNIELCREIFLTRATVENCCKTTIDKIS